MREYMETPDGASQAIQNLKGMIASGAVSEIQPRCDELAAHILDGAKARGWKIAAAESLTGGYWPMPSCVFPGLPTFSSVRR